MTTSPREHVARGEYWIGLNYGPVTCRFSMYGTEVFFHRFAKACRTSDPEQADYFFVPSFFKCLSILNRADLFDDKDFNLPSTILFDQTLEHVESFPYFARHDGADHLWLFSWGRYPCLLPFRNRLRHARFLQVEDRCEDLNSEGPQPTFSRWKDIIIPGNTDQWRSDMLQYMNRPFDRRDSLVCFYGRHAEKYPKYENVTVRKEIIKHLRGQPGCFVGGFVQNYHEAVTRSKFCLAPRGITPWTGHLYQALLAGCIPIILSDHFEVPYWWLDWASFSIRWRESNVESLHTYLSQLPVLTQKKMKQRVDEVGCWFDYSNTRGPCSPYQGVLRQLRQRRVPYPTRWHLPGHPVTYQLELSGYGAVWSLEEVESRIVHGHEVLVSEEKRHVVEAYLELRNVSTMKLRTVYS